MRIATPSLIAFASLVLACASGPLPGEGGPPPVFTGDDTDVAAPLERRGATAAREEVPTEELLPDPGSSSRVVAWVNDEVVTYRDVLLEVGPQLAVLAPGSEKSTIEQRALIGILRDRIIYHAAKDAGVELKRDELDELRDARVEEIKRNGGTLEAFLRERGMTRREYEREIVRTTVMERYLRSAMGVGGGDPRVRPMIDPYVSPAEVKDFYERNPEVFDIPRHGKLRIMIVQPSPDARDYEAAHMAARSKAENAQRRLRGGEDWVPVYRETVPEMAAEDPYALLEVAPGERAPWIDEFAFGTPSGAVSEVIEKGGTFYLMQNEGAVEARTLEYDDVHEKIRTLLGDRKRQLGAYEVELRLLEQATVRPVHRADDLRRVLEDARTAVLEQFSL